MFTKGKTCDTIYFLFCKETQMKHVKYLTLFSLCTCMLVLTGCAKPACHQNMVISNADIEIISSKPLKKEPTFKNIAVQTVTGGSETHPLLASQVNAKEFKSALEKSLDNVRLYHADHKTAPYRLEASLNKLEQPLLGLNMTVICHATYRIFNNKTNKLVYEKSLQTPYTEKLTSAFLGVERLKLANEGAVKENIKGLINDLYHTKEAI